MGDLSVKVQRRWATALTVVVLVPFAVGAYHQWFDIGSDYTPIGDWSLLEMRVRDVGRAWLTTGAYSRFGWYHPGPALFYALAGPYRLLGSAAVGVNIGGLLIGAAAVTGCALVAWRRGRLPTVIAVLLAVALLVRSFGADQLQNPWNAYVPILPFLLFLLLAWSVAVGDAWMVIPLVLTASFVIQCHLSYAIPTVPITALAIGACGFAVAHERATVDRRRMWNVLGFGLAAAVVLWLPTIWGTFIGDDGNVDAILTFSGRRVAGIGYGLRTMALQWGLRPEWIIGARRGYLTITTQPIETQWLAAPWVLVPVAGLVVARRRSDRDLAWISVISAVGLLVGVIGSARIVGPVVWYTTRWTWTLGALTGIVAILIVNALLKGRPGPRTAFLVLAVAVCVGATAMSTVDATRARAPASDEQAGVRRLVARIARRIPAHVPVVLDAGRHHLLDDYDIGLQLERRGFEVSVAPPAAERFGSERVPSEGRRATRLWLVSPWTHRSPPPGGTKLGADPGHYAVYLAPDGTGPSAGT